MNTTQTSTGIHPLMACAAVSVMLVSLLGVAAITGILPSSHSRAAELVGPVPNTENRAATGAPYAPYTQYVAPASAAVVHHKHVVHRVPLSYTQAQPDRQYTNNASSYGGGYTQPATPQPVPQPVAQTNYLGIATGAVVGGLLGHQVGGGNGRTLATIAGLVGGGYLGNEVEKRIP